MLEARLGVDKRTLERCFRALKLELDSSDYTKPLLKNEVSHIPVAAVAPYAHPQQDLREGVEVSVFYGRTQELAELEQWVVGDAPDKVLAGNYRKGYEDYGELLHQVAETRHHSCVILTSRE